MDLERNEPFYTPGPRYLRWRASPVTAAFKVAKFAYNAGRAYAHSRAAKRRRIDLPPSPSPSPNRGNTPNRRRMPRRSMYRRRRFGGRRRRFGGRRKYQSSVSTEQRDASMSYVRSRMPRGKKRAWVSFSRKFESALLRTQPLQTAIYNDTQRVVSSAGATGAAVANRNAVFSAALYCTNAAAVQDASPPLVYRYSETGGGEITDIFNAAYGSVPIDSYKLMFRTACLDVVITNLGTGSSDMVILDVYKVINKYDNNTNTTIRADFFTNAGEQDTTGVTGYSSGELPGNLGFTPFQNPNFCKRWKILNKRSMIIQPADTVRLQLRDTRNHWLLGKIINVTTGYYPKLGYGYLFIARGSAVTPLPTDTPIGRFGNSRAVSLAVSVSKTYQYYLPPTTKLRDSITNVDV
nr:MAG: putative capsid protein [Arizlama virus]